MEKYKKEFILRESREGPELKVIPEHVIPEERYYTCWGCKYREHNMVRSGKNPIYKNECTHPDALETYDWERGNLDVSDGSYMIPNSTNRTPPWCPFLKDVKSDPS